MCEASNEMKSWIGYLWRLRLTNKTEDFESAKYKPAFVCPERAENTKILISEKSKKALNLMSVIAKKLIPYIWYHNCSAQLKTQIVVYQ